MNSPQGLWEGPAVAPLGIKDYKKLDGVDKATCKAILSLFGAGGADADEKNEIGVTRLSFADAPLSEAWKEQAP